MSDRKWLISVFLGLALAASAVAQDYRARVTQVDRARFPKITVYVSITDSAGRPLSEPVPGELAILEGKQVVFRTSLWSDPAQATAKKVGPVSVVLVLDVSGSMAGEKLERAKEAASAYVSLAPAGFEMPVVAFANAPYTLCGFTTDKAQLHAAIRGLSANGSTALQDAIGSALDLLQGRPGRRAVVALTDGQENFSTTYVASDGQRRLLDRASAEGCSVSTIGLGGDVVAADLQCYECTGGFCLFAPTPDQLRGTFETMEQSLQHEWVFEYVTPFAEADGSRRNLSVVLSVSGQNVASESVGYVSPGVIPNVPGSHWPYLLLLVGLLAGPKTAMFLTSLVSVARFRGRCFERVKECSPLLTKRDPNVGPAGPRFSPGELVVLCPHCEAPHHVRSWRNNRCGCMRESRGKGRCCYTCYFPRWLRRALDALSGRSEGECGRRWLCRCAGDTDGY